MTSRRALLAAGLGVISCVFVSPLWAAEGPLDFVNALGNQVLTVIHENSSVEEKRAYFHRVLQEDFDIPGTAAFLLGPFWRVATESERREIIYLLGDYIVVTFGRRLYDYGAQTMRVIGSRGSIYTPTVVTEILRPGQAPIRLEWVLTTRPRVYRVFDLVLDGVSMAATKREEFSAIIQRAGGTVAGLIAAIRRAIAEAS